MNSADCNSLLLLCFFCICMELRNLFIYFALSHRSTVYFLSFYFIHRAFEPCSMGAINNQQQQQFKKKCLYLLCFRIEN